MIFVINPCIIPYEIKMAKMIDFCLAGFDVPDLRGKEGGDSIMKKRFAAVVLALSMCACLAACGDKKDEKGSGNTSAALEDGTEKNTEGSEADPEKETEAPTESAGLTIGSTETWGDYTVGIPEGWEFRKGDAFDENDTRYCQVKKDSFTFFDFKMESEETCKSKYEYNKNTYTNEQVDVSGTYGSIDWTGFQYSDGYGGYGVELYSTVNGKPVRVSISGYAFDSQEVKAVLETLVIK